jgi:hypothetical protein
LERTIEKFLSSTYGVFVWHAIITGMASKMNFPLSPSEAGDNQASPTVTFINYCCFVILLLEFDCRS